MTDHARSFTRPLLRQVENRQTAYVEILAMRAQHHPDLAAHLMTAFEALDITLPDDEVAEEPRPHLPTAQ
ncbi:MAG: hypothetical protein P8Q48_05970 [Paracoccaceae bacterium]|nr:hypothetical protein [Paracoccaceae bacterium]MDG1369776.1 hypothetical protein [Paracoccaceae bacterium]